jgi:hypothetical protein
MTLREWLQAEYDKARVAARRSRGGSNGSLEQHKHCSAVSRMCAFGEAMQQLDREPTEGAPIPPTDSRSLGCRRWPAHILVCLLCRMNGHLVCQLPCSNACTCTGAR